MTFPILDDDNSPAHSDDSNERYQQAARLAQVMSPLDDEYGTLSLDLDLDAYESDAEIEPIIAAPAEPCRDAVRESDDMRFPSLPSDLQSHATQSHQQQDQPNVQAPDTVAADDVTQPVALNIVVHEHQQSDATQVINPNHTVRADSHIILNSTQATEPVSPLVAPAVSVPVHDNTSDAIEVLSQSQAPDHSAVPSSMPPLEHATRDSYGIHYDLELSIDLDSTVEMDDLNQSTNPHSLSHSMSIADDVHRATQSRASRRPSVSSSSSGSLSSTQSLARSTNQPSPLVSTSTRPPAPLFHAPSPITRRASSIRSAALFLPQRTASRTNSRVTPALPHGCTESQLQNWEESQVFEDYPESPLHPSPVRARRNLSNQQQSHVSPPLNAPARSVSLESIDFSDAFDAQDERPANDDTPPASPVMSPGLNIAVSPISTFASQGEDFPVISLHLSEQQDNPQSDSLLYSNTSQTTSPNNSSTSVSPMAVESSSSHLNTPQRALPSVITGDKPISPNRRTPNKRKHSETESTTESIIAQSSALPSAAPQYTPSDDSTFIRRRRRLKRPAPESDDDSSFSPIPSRPPPRQRPADALSNRAAPQSSPIVVFDEGLSPIRRSPRIREKRTKASQAEDSLSQETATQEHEHDDEATHRVTHKQSSRPIKSSQESSSQPKSSSQTLAVPRTNHKRKRGHESTSSDEIENSDDDFEPSSPAVSAKRPSKTTSKDLMSTLRDDSSQSASKPSKLSRKSSSAASINPASRSTQSKISEYMQLRSDSTNRSALNDISNNKADAEPKWQSKKKKMKTSPPRAQPLTMRSMTPRRRKKSAFTIASPGSSAADVIEIDDDL